MREGGAVRSGDSKPMREGGAVSDLETVNR